MSESLDAAILFGGQGASLADAREITERHCQELLAHAGELLGCDPFERADESTRFAQPAVFLAAFAGWLAAEQAGVRPSAFAGHSLGELTALTAAGVFTPHEGLELVVVRAGLMLEADEALPGGMLAVLKADIKEARELARDGGVFLANYNAPGQTVLSGPDAAIAATARLARERGIRAIDLGVSGAFHSPAMASARVPFAAAVAACTPRAPLAPVISCTSAHAFRDLPRELSEALCAPVRWSWTMRTLARMGVGTFLDVGPDVVLARLTRRNLAEARALELEDLDVCV